MLDDGHRDGQPRSRGAAAFGPPPASGVPSASVRLHIADEIRQQLEGERFPREVEGPEPEALPHLRVRCHSRDPDDRSVRRRGTATQELQAVHARKADVEQDGIGRLALVSQLLLLTAGVILVEAVPATHQTLTSGTLRATGRTCPHRPRTIRLFLPLDAVVLEGFAPWPAPW